MKKEKVHDNAIKNITETGALKMGKITEENGQKHPKRTFRMIRMSFTYRCLEDSA